MLLQIKNLFQKSRKGISVMVGYVLLVTFVIILGIIVYQWMRTYVPQDEINCPDGVSISIQDYEFASTHLTLEIKNNGRFNVGGYFIYATNSPEQELAIIDISEYNADKNSRMSPTGIKFGGIGEQDNSLTPNEIETETFDLSDFSGTIYLIEIIPIRWQEEKNRKRLVSCKDAKIQETINYEGAGATCTDGQTQDCPLQEGVCSGSEKICTNEEWPACDYTEIENYESTETTCDDELDNDCDGYTDSLDTDCSAESSCNGTWVPPEDTGVECDGGANCIAFGELGECTCEEGYEPNEEGGCAVPVNSCKSYCSSLGYDDELSGCALNCGGACDGTCESGGNQYCSSPTTYCCCVH